jgi:uncharacterized protein (TIGR03083 family)
MTARGLTPLMPVYLVELFPGLHTELMTLLKGLKPSDWERPTACALWSVKDVAAHLLDTALRRLSYARDGLNPAAASEIESSGLVAYLNRLNAEWVAAARRLSPRVLMDLLDLTAPQLHAYFRSLDPHAPAAFGVAWAGEDGSPNWFDIGREYTERWLHQQQIREAVNAQLLSGREWLHPTLDIFMRALPFTYRMVDAEVGRSLRIEVSGDAGGMWTLVKEADGWRLFAGSEEATTTRVIMDQEPAWTLFSKGLSSDQARRSIRVEGDLRLGQPALGALAIMA